MSLPLLSPHVTSLDSSKVTLFRSKLVDATRTMLFASSLLFGDEVGLFPLLRDAKLKGLTAADLATQARVDVRYVQEWLVHMAASGVLLHDASTQTFVLPAEHALVLTDESSAAFATGMIEFGVGSVMLHDKLMRLFRSGGGLPWNELDPRCSSGLRRWFRTNYDHLLVQEWIPKLDADVRTTLAEGGLVADIGCGHGIATLRMARAFPHSTFIGYDYDPDSIAVAKKLAEEERLSNVSFQVGSAFALDAAREANQAGPPSHRFDLVCFFAAFHDMSHPEIIVLQVKTMLKPTGFVLLVEPWAGDTLQETCSSSAGALFAGVSMHYCTACAKSDASEASPTVLGAVSSNDVYQRLWITEGRFASMRVVPVDRTPNNRVLEVRLQQ